MFQICFPQQSGDAWENKIIEFVNRDAICIGPQSNPTEYFALLNRIKSSNSPILGFVSNLQKDKVINNSTYNVYEAYADYAIEEEKSEDSKENKNYSNILEKIKLTAKNIIEWIEK